MALDKYIEKRKFNITPEPRGKVEKSRGGLKFVIQKHQASHLHYDFRLEMEGVMKSWAVPKGPSLNPKDKRLAMMTEDHPMSYRTFEGSIPEGEYGAGDVIVWDEGTYEAQDEDGNILPRKDGEKKLLAGVHKGEIKFVIHGHKINGSFALVKMKGRGENTWLLIKHRDDFASEENVVANNRSVRSEKALGDDLHSKIYKDGQAIFRPAMKGKDKMPHNVSPMLATLVDEPFDNPDWLYEIKWDGYRAIAEVSGGRAGEVKVDLYSRNHKPFADKYPIIVKALQQLNHHAVLDGEITAMDAKGKSHFESLQNYGNDDKVTLLYQVFDLLYLDGVDLREQPLIERKKLLESLLQNFPKNSLIRYSDHIMEKGKAFFAQAAKQGLEGIMAKDSQSRYAPGSRSESWLKVKTHNRQEAIICGYTEPRSSRKFFGSVILGVYKGKELTYIGHTGTGFDDKSLKYLHEKLEQLKTDKSPFKKTPKTNMPATWVKPELICEVEFSEWTSEGHMRHPSFKGLREDKPASKVKKEEVKDIEPMPKQSPPSKLRAAKPKGKEIPGLELSNPDKIYWPKEKFTKGDMLAYYQKISKVMLPYLKDRPESLNRHPGGIKGPNFFQKNFTSEVPDFVDTFKFYSESNDADLRWLVCNNTETLLYMANLGCIEINPWSSTTKKPEHPTWMVIDLDPDDNHCDQVVEAALVTRAILKKAGADCYAKTSGKTGIHIFIPMGNKYDFDQIRQFGEIIANLVHQQIPDFTSVERSPSKRKKKIYIDFLQNRVGQTLAAPYSMRPTDGLTVSTPLQWKEVKKGWSPKDYTVNNIFKRLEKYGDLWKPVLGKGMDLKKVVKKLGG